jgi:hypothetical protein
MNVWQLFFCAGDTPVFCVVSRTLFILAAFMAATVGVSAQSIDNYSASNMWGTAPAGVAVPGALDSAIAHNQNSAVAGAVNAAEAGALFNGGSGITITSIGSQNIISTTVIGDGNDVDVDANQSSSNTGAVSNSGTVNN